MACLNVRNWDWKHLGYNKLKNFGIIGVGGYVAPRHLKAIKETGNRLIVASDITDSVGILDSYFPEADFFNNLEQLDAFLSEKKKQSEHLDYLSICSPNYLHARHIQFGLKHGVDIISEKPLVLSLSELDELMEYEKEYDAKVWSILQLRLHPAILKLRQRLSSMPKDQKTEVELTYITSRGKWYLKSWKGSEEKSGGLLFNIGVHFFDMLTFIFGAAKECSVSHRDKQTCSGHLEFERAKVKWFLSIDANYLPARIKSKNLPTYRSIMIEGKELEFSTGFTDLHTESYQNILSGNGFDLAQNRPALSLIEEISSCTLDNNHAFLHPFLRQG